MDENILNNFLSELKRGTQTIAILKLLSDSQYGYSLLQSLQDRNINIEAGTLYPLLRRLESQGLLRSDWDTSESRPRKYYVLSDEGHELLKRLVEEWNQLNNDMNRLLKGEK